MSDHEKDQNDSGDRDDYFFSDRRTIKSYYYIHAKKNYTLGEAKVERVVPNALPNQVRALPPHFRLWTPVVASSYRIAACGRASGLLALRFFA
jgi:hypothetical protein